MFPPIIFVGFDEEIENEEIQNEQQNDKSYIIFLGAALITYYASMYILNI